MKVKTNVLIYSNGNNPKTKYVSWTCDKCGAIGSTEIPINADNIPEDKRKCCES